MFKFGPGGNTPDTSTDTSGGFSFGPSGRTASPSADTSGQRFGAPPKPTPYKAPEQTQQSGFGSFLKSATQEAGNLFNEAKQKVGDIFNPQPDTKLTSKQQQEVNNTTSVQRTQAEQKFISFPTTYPNPQVAGDEAKLTKQANDFISRYGINPIDNILNGTHDLINSSSEARSFGDKVGNIISGTNNALKKIDPLYSDMAFQGIASGVLQMYGSSSKVIDHYIQTKLDPAANASLYDKGLFTVGHVVGSILSFVAGGEVLKGAQLGKLTLPVLFAATGETSMGPDATINQRLADIPINVVAGFLTSLVPGMEGYNAEALKSAAKFSSIQGVNTFLTSLVQGLKPEDAARAGASAAIVGGGFFAVGSAIGLLDEQVLTSKSKEGNVTISPESVISGVEGTDGIKGTPLGDRLTQAAKEAEAQGKDVQVNMKALQKISAFEKYGLKPSNPTNLGELNITFVDKQPTTDEQVSQIIEPTTEEAPTKAVDNYGLPETVTSPATNYTSALDFASNEFGAKPENQIGMVKATDVTVRDPVDPNSDQYKNLVASIQENGIQEPVRVTQENGDLITTDGSHRAQIAQDLGIQLPIIVNKGNVPGLPTIEQVYNSVNKPQETRPLKEGQPAYPAPGNTVAPLKKEVITLALRGKIGEAVDSIYTKSQTPEALNKNLTTLVDAAINGRSEGRIRALRAKLSRLRMDIAGGKSGSYKMDYVMIQKAMNDPEIGPSIEHIGEQIARIDDVLSGGTGEPIQQDVVTPETSALANEDNKPLSTELNADFQEGFIDPSAFSDAAKEKVNSVKDFISKTKEGVVFGKDIEDDIYKLKTNISADYIVARKLLENTKLSAKDAEAIYHYDENKSEPLTPEQKQIYDEMILPLKQENEAMFKRARDIQVPLDNENYTPRNIKGKGGVIDRMLIGVKGVRQGGILSKSTGSFKRRTMMALVNESGSRKIVSIKNGRVVEWDNKQAIDLGALQNKPNEDNYKSLKTRYTKYTDSSGRTWNITDATTKEIEKNTNLTYYKDVLSNYVLGYLKLKQIDRAIQFLEDLKSDPKFETMAAKVDSGNAPADWKPTQLLQFRGYLFEPHTADALDTVYSSMLSGQTDPLRSLTAMNSIFRTAIFIGPGGLAHIPNVAVHWAVDRGLTPFLNPLAYRTLFGTMVRAINATVHLNDDYVNMLRAGAPLLYANRSNREITDLFLKRLSADMERDQADVNLQQAAKLLGYANPIAWVKGLSRISNNLTWLSNDVMTLQAIYEEMDNAQKRGVTLPYEQAISDVGKHIPNYRIPSRVLNSKQIADVLKNPNVTMFSSYHYGMVKSYVEMAKDVVDKDSTIRDKAKSLDRIAMLAVILLVIYPFMDQLAKKLTGSKNSYFSRAGAASLPNNIYLTLKGQKDWLSTIESVVTPSAGSIELAQLIGNRDFFTGNKIYDTSSLPGMVRGAAAQALGTLTPANAYQRLQSGKLSLTDYLLQAARIYTPKNAPQTNKLESVIYEQRPQVLTQVKQAYTAGNDAQARSLINDYNKKLLQSAEDAASATGHSISSGQIKKDMYNQFIQYPSAKTIAKYKSGANKNFIDKELTPTKTVHRKGIPGT